MWTQWNGDIAQKKMDKALKESLEDVAIAVGEQADTQVPHDEGTLQRSKVIKQNPQNSSEWKIGYGGGPGTGFIKVPYALRWHEEKANFQKGRKWKYLRDPLLTTGVKTLPIVLQKRLSKEF